jgi:hypothetical protein
LRLVECEADAMLLMSVVSRIRAGDIYPPSAQCMAPGVPITYLGQSLGVCCCCGGGGGMLSEVGRYVVVPGTAGNQSTAGSGA